MSSSSEVEQARGGVWIHVADPVRLRDYFLRLGAHAKIVDDAGHLIVLVESADMEIEAYLDSWAAINQTAASTTKKPAPPSVPRLGARSVTRPRLGDLLLSKGMITDLQLKEALDESFAAGDLLGRVLLRRRWLFEDELARTLAEQLHLPYVTSGTPVSIWLSRASCPSRQACASQRFPSASSATAPESHLPILVTRPPSRPSRLTLPGLSASLLN